MAIVVDSYPSRAEGGPEGADRGEAHLNDLDSIQIEYFSPMMIV